MHPAVVLTALGQAVKVVANCDLSVGTIAFPGSLQRVGAVSWAGLTSLGVAIHPSSPLPLGGRVSPDIYQASTGFTPGATGVLAT